MEKNIFYGHNFMVDYVLPDGRYWHMAHILPDPWGYWDVSQAFLQLAEEYARRGMRICGCIYLAGTYTLEQLSAFQEGRDPMPDTAKLLFLSPDDYREELRGRFRT